MKIVNTWRFLTLAVATICFTSSVALGAAPLSLADLETLLKGKVSNVRIAHLIKERKVGFELSKESEKRLRKLGANQAVIKTITRSMDEGMIVESVSQKREDRKYNPSSFTTTPAPPREKAEMALINVRTQPVKSYIYLDNKKIGESPVEFLASLGRHQIKLVPVLSGKYEAIEKDITVEKSRINTIFLRFDPKI